ncbi:MAG: hypothetical protein HYR85_17035 [Planctomycetes bacterium]|nr:hypothetical protein [Planctomycetota bacterium]
MRNGFWLVVPLLVGAIGCTSARYQESGAPPKSGHVDLQKAEKKPGPISDLSYPESFDRGIARFVSMGMNTVEGMGRDMDHDGLVCGVLPSVANLLTEGIVGDLFIDGLGGAFLYLSGSDEVARQARLKAAHQALRAHLSFVPGPEGSANIVETEKGYDLAEQKFVGQIYPVNFDQSLGSLVGMPFGIVRQIGRNFDDNGFVVGIVELIPNTFVSIVGEIGGGLGKFGTLIVGQGEAAESIDRWQRNLESNNKLITGH